MPEFLPTAKVEYTFAGRTYVVNVNEYGGADVSCFYGRGVEWRYVLRPTQTLREQNLTTSGLSDPWIVRLDAAIDDMRLLVLPDVEYGTGDGKTHR